MFIGLLKSVLECGFEKSAVAVRKTQKIYFIFQQENLFTFSVSMRHHTKRSRSKFLPKIKKKIRKYLLLHSLVTYRSKKR